MKFLFRNTIIFFTWALISSITFAANWFGVLNFGGGVESVGKTQNVRLYDIPSPGVTNGYVANNNTEFATLMSMGVGYQFNPQKNWQFALATLGSYVGYGTITGTVHPFINVGPDFDTLKYQYHAQSFAFLAEPILIYHAIHQLNPFVALGIGASWNKLYDYSESLVLGSTAIPSGINFRHYTQVSFAFAPSIGVERMINKHIGISLAYQYFNAGKAYLNPKSNQGTNNRLSAGTLDTQLLTLSLLFS